MTIVQKKEIQALVASTKESMGSARAVGVKCGVSEAMISLILNDKWDAIADKTWIRIGQALGWSQAGWQVVETTNTRLLNQVYTDAKENSLWMAVSYQAGSGKTVSGRTYAATYASEACYFIQAREWSRRQFLAELCKVLGIGYPASATTEGMIELIVDFLVQRAHLRPLIILDETDKLKADALRVLIPLYNELEDKVGFVIQGTENLQRKIEIGVQWNKQGFDELHSRFGRSFVHLYGATKADIKNICQANGISDPATIEAIWKEAGPRQMNIQGQFVAMVDDLRRVRRAVTREVIKLSENNGNQNSHSHTEDGH